MYTSIDPNNLDQKQLQQYLLAAVAPRPISFASTLDKNGNVNLSPFSFFNVFSSNPPILIFSPARSSKDNTLKHTLENVTEVNEVVINIIDYDMVQQMSLSSTAYEKGINEFVKSGLTQVKSTKVRPPRVGEAPISFECKVDHIIPLGDGPGAGNLVISRVVFMHIKEQYLDKSGTIETEKMDWVARMGSHWYARISKEQLFQLPKPNKNMGIGVDQLPLSVQHSNILTGNDLGCLGNADRLPTKQQVEQAKQHVAVREILFYDKRIDKKRELHKTAQFELRKGNQDEALAILCIADQLTYDD